MNSQQNNNQQDKKTDNREISSLTPTMGDQGQGGPSRLAVGGIVLGLVLGLGVGVWWSRDGGTTQVADDEIEAVEEEREGDDEEEEADENGEVTEPTQAEEDLVRGVGSVEARDQEAGTSVAVARASAAQDSWVVVREDANGHMGNILGARWFPAGEHEDIQVNLLRGTAPGQRYHVVLHVDNSTVDRNRVFDRSRDLPVADDEGHLISATFSTNAE